MSASDAVVLAMSIEPTIPLRSDTTYTADEVWEIIEDMIHSVALAETARGPRSSVITDTLTDYVTNQYGIDS